MLTFPPTLIFRHKKENLKKCSLHGLETRPDMRFYTYPKEELPADLSGYVLLSLDGPALSEADASSGLLLLDGTWRYAALMMRKLSHPLPRRSIPSGFQTAYPRRQDDCQDPARGLASLEALYIAYTLMGRDASDLLDRYHWRTVFLDKNPALFNK